MWTTYWANFCQLLLKLGHNYEIFASCGPEFGHPATVLCALPRTTHGPSRVYYRESKKAGACVQQLHGTAEGGGAAAPLHPSHRPPPRGSAPTLSHQRKQRYRSQLTYENKQSFFHYKVICKIVLTFWAVP
jgi:hypothetical protein